MARTPLPDLGRLLYAVRPLPTARAWLVMLAPAVVFAVLGWFAPPQTWWTAAVPAAAYLLFIAALGGAGWIDKHRVYERGVVLGPTWPGATPYVVPLDTIDPTSVTVHHHANRINQRIHQNGQPTMRMAVYSTRAVSFAGLHYDEAGGRTRSDSKAFRAASTLLGQQPMSGGRTCRWVLGVKDPAPLVAAIMQSFEATGRVAPGAARDVLSTAIEEPSGQPVAIR
ncbi:MAG TPA: hypothetical protein VH419_07820 [Nocardioidaceae bacterium]|jgi:hypothetical protein